MSLLKGGFTVLQTLPAPFTGETRIRGVSPNAMEQRIQQRLRQSPYRHLKDVQCRLDGRTAFLTGILPSYFMKQMAQEVVRRVDGVTAIDNQVEVWTAEERQP
ncbi:BON domain-containing protein [Aureliella helgolandensis]|nr:BON domain-containing protein [Aureliella helgolandensis]